MIRLVICDDDVAFLERLRSEIRAILKRREIEAVIHTYASAEEIPDSLLASSDIFFLDIDFPGKPYSGIDIAKKIRSVRQDSILIFVTNYIEYAPEGYEVQAFRYALKSDISSKLEQYLLHALEKLDQVREALQFKVSGETVTLPAEDILYIESQAHIAVLYAQRPGDSAVKAYKIYASLSSMEEALTGRGFLRIQKSYLVNMRRLRKFQCSGAALDNGTVLPVSEKSYAEKKKQFLLWKGRT